MVAITSEVVAIVLVCISVVIAYDAVLQHDAIAERMQRRDKMDLEKIDEAVEMCCPLENSECCQHALLFHQPINCTGMNAKRRVDIVICVEPYLCGNERKALVQDRICCEVYGGNHNDRDDVCRSLCNTIAMTPSLPRHAKLERIRHCKMANHGLNGCFDHCLTWRVDHEEEPWRFEQHCDVEYTLNRLDTSEKYLLFESGESI